MELASIVLTNKVEPAVARIEIGCGPDMGLLLPPRDIPVEGCHRLECVYATLRIEVYPGRAGRSDSMWRVKCNNCNDDICHWIDPQPAWVACGWAKLK